MLHDTTRAHKLLVDASDVQGKCILCLIFSQTIRATTVRVVEPFE
jgi:hypothetical protein